MEVAGLPVTQTVASVTVTPANGTFCEGETGFFTATETNGGSLPVFQWFVNGSPVGTGGSSYSAIFIDGDVVTCTMISNQLCVTGSPATSNAVTISIQPNLTVTVGQDTFTTCYTMPVTQS